MIARLPSGGMADQETDERPGGLPSSAPLSLNGDHVDDKGHQGEHDPCLLEAGSIERAAKGGVKAGKEIGHQGRDHVIGTHCWNGIIVQSAGIASRTPHQNRDASYQCDQQAIRKPKPLEPCT